MGKKYYSGKVKTEQQMLYKTFKMNNGNEVLTQLGANVTAWIAAIAFIAVVCILLMFPVMWLWNWLMPLIFGLCRINIWQALGLNLLSAILFKSNK